MLGLFCGCLVNQALADVNGKMERKKKLADVRSTGEGINCLHCIFQGMVSHRQPREIVKIAMYKKSNERCSLH